MVYILIIPIVKWTIGNSCFHLSNYYLCRTWIFFLYIVHSAPTAKMFCTRLSTIRANPITIRVNSRTIKIAYTIIRRIYGITKIR